MSNSKMMSREQYNSGKNRITLTIALETSQGTNILPDNRNNVKRSFHEFAV